jgi:hypothetical protein
MKSPARLAPLEGRRRQHLRLLERRFQEQALGPEMARVNLDLSPAQRLDYLSSMREIARRKDVPAEPNYSVAWMVKLEEELARENPEPPKP